MTEVDRKLLLRAMRAAAGVAVGPLRNASRNATVAAGGSAGAGAASAAAAAAASSLAGGWYNESHSLGNASGCGFVGCCGNATTTDAADLHGPPANRYWVLIMFLVPIFTIFGNILVVLAVHRERSLQSVTNYFIVSLAFADILVAAIVMPVSVYVEVRNGHWDFSDTLCDLWIMCDALFSTASILNLVAISIDRFIAVTQPIKYSKHKNSKRTHVTIAGSWLLSIAIALPIGCGLQNLQGVRYQERFRHVCTFFNGDFLIYSSLGSFYIPCLVMLVLYYRIFTVIRARAKKAAASRRGKIYENARANVAAAAAAAAAATAAATDEAAGGGRQTTAENAADGTAVAEAVGDAATAQQAVAALSAKKVAKNSSPKAPPAAPAKRERKKSLLLLVRSSGTTKRPQRLSVSAVSASDCLACRTDGIYTGEEPIPHTCGYRHYQIDHRKEGEEVDEDEEDEEEEEEEEEDEESPMPIMNESHALGGGGPSTSDNSGDPTGATIAANPCIAAPTSAAAAATNARKPSTRRVSSSSTTVAAADGNNGGSGKPRQRLFQLKKLKKKSKRKKGDRSAARREKKATKTLAIVLGVFLLCWLPFFITNLMWAACLKNMDNAVSLGPICGYDRRINVFIVWLGYVNSFMNPLIYTIFNTEFRKAFKKILHID